MKNALLCFCNSAFQVIFSNKFRPEKLTAKDTDEKADGGPGPGWHPSLAFPPGTPEDTS